MSKSTAIISPRTGAPVSFKRAADDLTRVLRRHAWERPDQQAFVYLGDVPAAVVPLLWLRAIVIYLSSKFVVTTKRVTIKVGFLSRRSFEVLINKVEGIPVEQGLFERMYRGGSLIISGTGGSKEVFTSINDPVRFQRSVQDAAAGYGG